jgi:hypothetical protein
MGDADLLSFAALNFGFREEVFSGTRVGEGKMYFHIRES